MSSGWSTFSVVLIAMGAALFGALALTYCRRWGENRRRQAENDKKQERDEMFEYVINHTSFDMRIGWIVDSKMRARDAIQGKE